MHCLFGNHCEGIQLIYTAREGGRERGRERRASAMEVASGLVLGWPRPRRTTTAPKGASKEIRKREIMRRRRDGKQRQHYDGTRAPTNFYDEWKTTRRGRCPPELLCWSNQLPERLIPRRAKPRWRGINLSQSLFRHQSSSFLPSGAGKGRCYCHK